MRDNSTIIRDHVYDYTSDHTHDNTRLSAIIMMLAARLYALCFLLYALCALAEQDCGPCKGVLRTAFLCTRILGVTTSLCNIREASIAVESAQIITVIRHFSRLLLLFLRLCTLWHNQKSHFGLEFTADYRPIASGMNGWC